MWRMMNLPDRHSDVQIKATAYEGSVRVHTDEGWTICDIDAATPQGMANDIADAIRMARGQGFEQGRQYVRDALGVK